MYSLNLLHRDFILGDYPRRPDYHFSIPCQVSYPSCVGLPDGPNAYSGRERSPYYIICRDERSVNGTLFCPQDAIFPTSVLFHAGTCKPIHDIPREDGGRAPDCSTAEDGKYRNEDLQCDVYYTCLDHAFLGHAKCADGLSFNRVPQSCRPQEWNVANVQPCGGAMLPDCIGKDDGLYPDEGGVCPVYYQCVGHRAIDVRSCPTSDSRLFNPVKGRCDYPPNFPGPCGVQ